MNNKRPLTKEEFVDKMITKEVKNIQLKKKRENWGKNDSENDTQIKFRW